MSRLTHGPEPEMFICQGTSKPWISQLISPTERSESVSGMSANKPGQVIDCRYLHPMSLQRVGPVSGNQAAPHRPEVFLSQVLLRDQLNTESQLRRRKQVPSWERTEQM